MLKDFTPAAETISLHGLGFIQVKLDANQRLHVWHPELPRRACFEHSAIHNHRFGFTSRVLIGTQVNARVDVAGASEGSHDIISHDGPRSPKGGRLSYVSGNALVVVRGQETVAAGSSYRMAPLEYHHTPNAGIVVTVMQKEVEGDIHACSLIERGHVFDQDFDRFQLSPSALWSFVVDALSGGGPQR